MQINEYFTGLRCIKCSTVYSADSDLLLCPKCENLLDAEYNLDALKQNLNSTIFSRYQNTIWRWRELMPVKDFDKIVTLGEGGSTLLEFPELAKMLNISSCYILSDIGMPTGSLKDRSIAITATKAKEFGYSILSCDSTGNKAASVAAYAARAGLSSVVFCPKDTPEAKLLQTVGYGAQLIRVDGHYSEINTIYRELSKNKELKWYDCGTDNPFRYEGKKTYAYEIAEGMSWKIPTKVLQPAAGGMSIVKAWKGFKELLTLGLTEKLPAMYACQAAQCAPIVSSWEKKSETVTPVVKGATIASAIAVSNPALLGDLTLKTLYESEGGAVAIEDSELLYYWRILNRLGIFSEPSGSISIAAAFKLSEKGMLNPEDSLVCVITGSGFKDIDSIQSAVKVPDTIYNANYGELERYAQQITKTLNS